MRYKKIKINVNIYKSKIYLLFYVLFIYKTAYIIEINDNLKHKTEFNL